MPQEETREMREAESQMTPVLAGLLSKLSNPFHRGLLEEYIASPSQETIERYLEGCRRGSSSLREG